MVPPQECDPDWNQMSEAEAAELIAVLAAIDPNEKEAHLDQDVAGRVKNRLEALLWPNRRDRKAAKTPTKVAKDEPTVAKKEPVAMEEAALEPMNLTPANDAELRFWMLPFVCVAAGATTSAPKSGTKRFFSKSDSTRGTNIPISPSRHAAFLIDCLEAAGAVSLVSGCSGAWAFCLVA